MLASHKPALYLLSGLLCDDRSPYRHTCKIQLTLRRGRKTSRAGHFPPPEVFLLPAQDVAAPMHHVHGGGGGGGGRISALIWHILAVGLTGHLKLVSTREPFSTAGWLHILVGPGL